MPHGTCFLWRGDLLVLHVVTDALIAIAYVAIAGILAWFASKRRDLPFKNVFAMFALFIVSCAGTHLMSIWVLWHPDYWIEGIIKAITATASIGTAILLVPMLPRALALRSPRELQALNDELAQTLDELHAVVRDYEHEKYIATAYQTASLSTVPPAIDDIRISAMYRAGSGDLQIGGDWYDAFALLDGRIIASIGDVTGAGLGASIIMSRMRQAIRIGAQIHVDPARILDAASRSLQIEFPDSIVTAFVAIIDFSSNTLVYANAGHPRPFVRHIDGRLEELDGSALPLGLRSRGDEQSRTWDLKPGALIVLFTDGLTESTHDYALGEQRLTRALGEAGLSDADDPARAIFNRVLFDGARDDVAILTLLLPKSRRRQFDEEWIFQAADRDRAGDVQRAIAMKIAQRGGGDDDVFNAVMVLSELVSNVYRYAAGTVTVRVDWRGDTMVMHVLDEGTGFEFLPELPDDPMSERGRGLFIINALVEDFHIAARQTGGSHARVVLRAPRRERKYPALQIAERIRDR